MIRAGVPCVPGSDGALPDDPALRRAILRKAGHDALVGFLATYEEPATGLRLRDEAFFGYANGVLQAEGLAAAISRNAVAACETAGIPLIALTRPPWVAAPGDAWSRVPDIAAAVAYLAAPDAGWTTGQILQVNGGTLLGRG